MTNPSSPSVCDLLLCLPSDYSPSDRRGTLFTICLVVPDLYIRLDEAIAKRVAMDSSYGHFKHPRAQITQEYHALCRIKARLVALPKDTESLTVASGELPLDLNDLLFAGAFQTIDCRACGSRSRPDDTVVEPWDEGFEAKGMQHYGAIRRCRCGTTVGVRIDGWRRP